MSKRVDLLESFIAEWQGNSAACREVFISLKNHLESLEGVLIEFLPRPGVTYSLRGVCPGQDTRPLFVMIDVIDAEPRWLSVCFYSESVTDPEELGDYVPGGLLGEDGICFDLESNEDKLLNYVVERIDEAYKAELK